ncbi:DUF1002 domain-containing protein [Virgibacillus sp. YIM 98842]|uniref:DUF1002 domain-containing protein n=1 Tax=Virgibacillus sp. YIM 98842 TaxID=2663533 RepID=UPI0013D96E85|nr:DUF1002 domain-containing protein [Virgibacillus sp. YIM 98842]
MKNNYIKILALFVLVIGLVTGFTMSSLADDGGGASDSDNVNERIGSTIVTYGDALSEAQREEVRALLRVDEASEVEEYDVTGEDIAYYIDGNPNSNMYSSAKIVRQEEGNGLTINIITPSNITDVTKEMYANAMLTAGVENATVDVASPVQVTGSSALTGIYKAYDVEGEELDKERMELANDELDVATDLAEQEGMDQEKVSQLLTEIKQMIAEMDPVSREEVEQIVQEQLDNLEINLSEEDRQRLIDLFDRMRDLNIDFDQVRNQLDDIANTIMDRAEELGLDEGFWQNVANFFSEMFQAISNFFSGLFN